VQLRHLANEQAELRGEVDALRKQTEERFEDVFTVLDKLISDDEATGKKTGLLNSN
jgi:hypothetical protein